MEPQERLKFIREKLALSQQQFAVEIGASQGTVKDIERGAILKITPKLAKKVTDKFTHVNPEWLRAGIGEPFLDEVRTILNNQIDKSSEHINVQQSSYLQTNDVNSNLSRVEIVKLPYLVGNINFTLISRDGLQQMLNNADTIELPSWVAKDADFTYRVLDNEMVLKGIVEGTLLLVKKQELFRKNGDLLVIHDIEENKTCCRIVELIPDRNVYRISTAGIESKSVERGLDGIKILGLVFRGMNEY